MHSLGFKVERLEQSCQQKLYEEANKIKRIVSKNMRIGNNNEYQSVIFTRSQSNELVL